MSSGYDVAALSRLIEQFERMPGIGHKSAQRMAFYVLDMTDDDAKQFAQAITDAHTKIHRCKICCNLTEGKSVPFAPMRRGTNPRSAW